MVPFHEFTSVYLGINSSFQPIEWIMEEKRSSLFLISVFGGKCMFHDSVLSVTHFICMSLEVEAIKLLEQNGAQRKLV